MLFAEIEEPMEPFTNSHELLLKLESKEYKAVVYYQLVINSYLNPVEFRDKAEFYERMATAYAINPPVVANNLDDAMETVLNSSGLVLITWGMDVFYIQSKYCGIRIQFEDVMPVTWSTSYFRSGFGFQLLTGSNHLINKELIRLHTEYYPSYRCDKPKKLISGAPLSFYQLQSIFWVLGGGAVVGTLGLFLECFRQQLCMKEVAVHPK